MLIVTILTVVPSVRADESVTLEILHKEMLELKAEIQSLRQEMRSGARPQVRTQQRRAKGTNDVTTVRSANRPPKDPEARKAWYAERHKAYEEKLRAIREKHGAKKAAAKPAE